VVAPSPRRVPVAETAQVLRHDHVHIHNEVAKGLSVSLEASQRRHGTAGPSKAILLSSSCTIPLRRRMAARSLSNRNPPYRESAQTAFASWSPTRNTSAPGSPEKRCRHSRRPSPAVAVTPIGRITTVGPLELEPSAAVLEGVITPGREPMAVDLKLAKEPIQGSSRSSRRTASTFLFADRRGFEQ
jgi:hypothetical protein